MLELHYFTQSFFCFFVPFPELFLKKYHLFIWVFAAAQGLSLIKVSRGYSLDAVRGFSLWSTGPRACGLSSCAQA